VDPARIAELLKPFLTSPHFVTASATDQAAARAASSLSTLQLQQISIYIDMLQRWNTRINLTSVRSPEEIVTRHFGESLFAARHLFPCATGNTAAAISPDYVWTAAAAVQSSFSLAVKHPVEVFDLGSGAGFPGVPIKIWIPSIHLTLIESNHKKATFLRETIRALTLTDVNVFPGRAEDLLPRQPSSAPAHTSPASPASEAPPDRQASVVTLRAVERFSSILPIAANLVTSGGRLVLLIGKAQVPAALSILPAFHWRDPLPVPLSTNRLLLVGHLNSKNQSSKGVETKPPKSAARAR
jgi:16S rRNA (guanine527-N7)-methyltransferase